MYVEVGQRIMLSAKKSDEGVKWETARGKIGGGGKSF